MLNIAFIVLACAASLGVVLALGFRRADETVPAIIRAARSRARGLGLVHGGLGAVGLLILLAALRNPEIRPAVGAAGFGRVAAWLLGVALLFGLAVLATMRARRGGASLLIAVHATLAIAGVVVLLALVLLGTAPA